MPNLTYTYRGAIRDSAILTNLYVESMVLGPNVPSQQAMPVNNNTLVLLVAFTKGSLDSAEIKVEYSNDGITYYGDTNASMASTDTTLALNGFAMSVSGNYIIQVSNLVAQFVRVSAKGTGTVTSSSMGIEAILAVRP